MKKIRNTLLIILSVILIGASSFSTAVYAASPDEAVLSEANDNYTPLYTTSPHNSDGDLSLLKEEKSNSALFYTQTTFLALMAGYLILFKAKGFDHSQKMHRRLK